MPPAHHAIPPAPRPPPVGRDRHLGRFVRFGQALRAPRGVLQRGGAGRARRRAGAALLSLLLPAPPRAPPPRHPTSSSMATSGGTGSMLTQSPSPPPAAARATSRAPAAAAASAAAPGRRVPRRLVRREGGVGEGGRGRRLSAPGGGVGCVGARAGGRAARAHDALRTPSAAGASIMGRPRRARCAASRRRCAGVATLPFLSPNAPPERRPGRRAALPGGRAGGARAGPRCAGAARRACALLPPRGRGRPGRGAHRGERAVGRGAARERRRPERIVGGPHGRRPTRRAPLLFSARRRSGPLGRPADASLRRRASPRTSARAPRACPAAQRPPGWWPTWPTTAPSSSGPTRTRP